jgi:Zinc-ribbon
MKGYYKQIDPILEHDKMPPEYDNHYSDILCYDCRLKSRTKYHFIYHECEVTKGGCGGYNTRVLRSCVVNPQSASTRTAGAVSGMAEIPFHESRRVTTTGIHPPVLPAERDHPTLQDVDGAREDGSSSEIPADVVMFVSGDGQNVADENIGMQGNWPAPG